MSLGEPPPKALRGALNAATERSREWQAQQIRQTGFATPQAELGHAVIAALRERGYHPTVAHVAGQLAAVGTAHNWQGCARIAQIVGRCERTVQRARATLEADGLITSHLLLTGQYLPGQRSPVRHPQVVRDVSRLQRLAGVAQQRKQQPPRTNKRRPSAAEVPTPPEPTAAELDAKADNHRRLAEAHPEYAVFHLELAAAAAAAATKQRATTPPPNAAPVVAEDIDQWERATAELEERQARERGPPKERGPPPR